MPGCLTLVRALEGATRDGRMNTTWICTIKVWWTMGRREDWTAPTSHPHGALQECPHYRLLRSTCRSVTRHQRPCRRQAWWHPCPSATLSTTVTSSHSEKHFASLHKEVVGVDSFHWLFPVVWVPTSGTLGLEGGSRNSYNIDSSWRPPWWSRLHDPNAGDLDSILVRKPDPTCHS